MPIGFKALILASFFLGGCSSFAYKSYACEKQFPYGAAAGYIFQVGDCAISKYFYIETGDYYRTSKWFIDLAVEVHEKHPTKTYESLLEFARVFNCEESAFQLFADVVANKRVEIFGDNFENSPRRVTLNIIQAIEIDPILRTQCMR